MTAEINLVLAFVAGLLSFLSPCVLPLIPSYLSFVSGVSFKDLGEAGAVRWMILSRTVFFVAGFTIVFVALGILFSGPALLFSNASRWINFGAGLVVVLLGINIAFDLVGALNVERRFHTTRRPTGYLGAILVGMAFGAGWSPCIGPILASILFLAGTQGEAGRAAILLLVYSLGLGLPFLVTGAAFTRVSAYLQRGETLLWRDSNRERRVSRGDGVADHVRTFPAAQRVAPLGGITGRTLGVGQPQTGDGHLRRRADRSGAAHSPRAETAWQATPSGNVRAGHGGASGRRGGTPSDRGDQPGGARRGVASVPGSVMVPGSRSCGARYRRRPPPKMREKIPCDLSSGSSAYRPSARSRALRSRRSCSGFFFASSPYALRTVCRTRPAICS
jgi:cytochrome c biogenesis protein CcdA